MVAADARRGVEAAGAEVYHSPRPSTRRSCSSTSSSGKRDARPLPEAGRLRAPGSRSTRASATPDEIVEEVFKAGLRGRGGAGFPTGQKWKFLAKNDKPRYLVVNADESEPGTFKDKLLIDRDPHPLLEGILISRLRDQGEVRLHLHPRRVRARRPKILQKRRRRGGGGAASSRASRSPSTAAPARTSAARRPGCCRRSRASAATRRSSRRSRPSKGLFRCPTIVNNVETLLTVTHIIKNGADWFRKMGTEKSPGMKIFSVCGHVEPSRELRDPARACR